MEIIWGRFVEKTGGKKSRATVPLRVKSVNVRKITSVQYILLTELYLGLGYFCQLDFKIQNIRYFLYSTVLIKLHAIKNQLYCITENFQKFYPLQ